MTTDVVGAPSGSEGVGLSSEVRLRIFLYLGVLIVLLGFGSPFGGLIGLPISFFLKNKLHLPAHEVAVFGLLCGLPLYLSFMFGFIRDMLNPLGIGDRAMMVLFGTISAAGYAFSAFTPVTYESLLISVLLLTTAFLFTVSAQTGLTSTIGQQQMMSGQVSAVWNVFQALPLIAASLLGGVLSDRLEGRNADEAARILFLFGASIMTLVALLGLLKPRSVFDNIRVERGYTAPLGDFRRLVMHRPVYPALLIWLLWNFAPGSVTPLQYYLQNDLHATDTQWGQWNAVATASFIPMYLLFGVLCRRVPLRLLLVWGSVCAIPQFVPFLFIHSVNVALIAAVLIGVLGGVATAAYMDLLIRSCPPGLQGSVLMMAGGLLFIAVRLGDLLGTRLYEYSGGFTGCVIAITVVYALIVPVLLLVPKSLIATPDGQAT
jgi:MFS family permease